MEKYLKTAGKMGADGAEIFRMRGRMHTVSSESGGTRVREYDSSSGYGLRVLKKRRLGFSYFCRGEDAERAVRQALSLSRFSKPSGFEFPGKARYPRLKVFDGRVEGLDEGDGAALLNGITGAIPRSVKPVKCGAEWGAVSVELENSSGLSATGKSTQITCFAHCRAGKSSGSFFKVSNNLDFDASSVGSEAARRAGEMRNAKPVESGVIDAVFEPEAIYSIMSLLLPSFHGERVYRKASALHNSMGKAIADARFSLYDDPLSDGPGSFMFDGEGVPCGKKALVERGIVSGFLFDLGTACLMKGKRPVAGNCDRPSYLSQPSIGVSNMVVGKGETKDAVEECREGILVGSAFGSHTANDLTGEFSLSVDRGFRIAKGETRGPARGNVISGNAFGLLKSISSIERKRRRHYNLISPRISFSGVRVVG